VVLHHCTSGQQVREMALDCLLVLETYQIGSRLAGLEEKKCRHRLNPVGVHEAQVLLHLDLHELDASCIFDRKLLNDRTYRFACGSVRPREIDHYRSGRFYHLGVETFRSYLR